MKISRVRSRQDMRAAAGLMRGLYEANKALYADDLATIEAYYQGAWFFQAKPVIPPFYSPPLGEVLLARLQDQPAGCVAICRMDAGHCELKSMFVAPDCRGRGVARALCMASLDLARSQGYRTIRLTTGLRQTPARRLYQSLGFRPVDPWERDPPEGYTYFALDLSGPDDPEPGRS